MPSPAPQRVLITAAAAGIGKAIALAFREAGADVHAVDIDPDAVATLNAEHPAIHTTVADAADESAVAKVFESQTTRTGGIDVLINCAGIAGPTALLEEIELTDWRRCIAVNLDAAFLCCRRAIPLMRAAGRGCIINISSTAGWHGYPLRTPYASAKWALIGLTKSIAMELGPAGIRANAICPGSIDGERMDRVIAAEAARKNMRESDIRKQYTDGVSLRTFIDARDIANAALFLASDAASKITGQIINVDGHMENTGGLG
ncbi:MAG: SDR family oxidoreductase [Gammaproteobacteria bacterium]|nr:SDR family oxidoreductase [Gammaproteobacteria bacterium]MDA7961136.1 SDR family oxidoreductase [Gammaproteobacteria bacterium]MDA7969521.1 SDR family oxidoreductase [Gammaproteobacteria bacterium]MDA8024395.1 SDR family oxidoreductase [Gammaproteobacteria bacterium]